jgi:hypothetical protein
MIVCRERKGDAEDDDEPSIKHALSILWLHKSITRKASSHHSKALARKDWKQGEDKHSYN